jgi:hypothetical protein
VFTCDGNIVKVYYAGSLVGSAVGSAVAWPAGVKTLRAFGWSGTAWEPDADMSVLGYSNEVWSPSQAADFHSDPYSVYDNGKRWLYTGMGSGSWTPLEVAG